MYKIKDMQLGDYLGDGELFETLDDVRDKLISFHLVDVEPELLEKSTLAELCAFDWEVQDEDGSPVSIKVLEKVGHKHTWVDGKCACGELELF